MQFGKQQQEEEEAEFSLLVAEETHRHLQPAREDLATWLRSVERSLFSLTSRKEMQASEAFLQDIQRWLMFPCSSAESVEVHEKKAP